MLTSDAGGGGGGSGGSVSPLSPSSPSPAPPVSSRHSAVTTAGTTGTALGLRRSSWQLHLPLPMQRLFARIATFMDGPLMLCIIVMATLVAIFLEDLKGQSSKQRRSSSNRRQPVEQRRHEHATQSKGKRAHRHDAPLCSAYVRACLTV